MFSIFSSSQEETSKNNTYEYSSTDMGDLGDIDEFSGSEIYNEEYYRDRVSSIMGDMYNLYNRYKSIMKEELTSEFNKYSFNPMVPVETNAETSETSSRIIPNYYVENGI